MSAGRYGAIVLSVESSWAMLGPVAGGADVPFVPVAFGCTATSGTWTFDPPLATYGGLGTIHMEMQRACQFVCTGEPDFGSCLAPCTGPDCAIGGDTTYYGNCRSATVGGGAGYGFLLEGRVVLGSNPRPLGGPQGVYGFQSVVGLLLPDGPCDIREAQVLLWDYHANID